MGFKLLQDDPLWLRVEILGEGYFDRGVWKKGNTNTKYEEFEGIWEPYKENIVSRVLPEGVYDEDCIYVFTDKELKTHSDDRYDPSIADTIYLQNPECNQRSRPFRVFKDMSWVNNKGFSLLSGHHEYICIKEEKLTEPRSN